MISHKKGRCSLMVCLCTVLMDRDFELVKTLMTRGAVAQFSGLVQWSLSICPLEQCKTKPTEASDDAWCCSSV
jgi:hypothetical protein